MHESRSKVIYFSSNYVQTRLLPTIKELIKGFEVVNVVRDVFLLSPLFRCGVFLKQKNVHISGAVQSIL